MITHKKRKVNGFNDKFEELSQKSGEKRYRNAVGRAQINSSEEDWTRKPSG